MMGKPGLAAIVVVLSCAAACEDVPECTGPVTLAIETSQITGDVDPVAAGVQADVEVQTSLREGETVELEVFGPDARLVDTYEAAADSAGLVVFDAISVTTPTATLRARASGLCGLAMDQVVVAVTAAE
ncbi:MAG TPA: hypothetical protein VFQ53_09390 [Kofleriaceae bacterium]|nr:hypothetical protein [Kofleriaceae bacterium]